MPRLLKAAEIVEVVAEPLLVKVPSFTTCAVLPLSAAPKLLVMMFNPLFVVWSLNVAPSAIVSVPEPTSLTPVFGFESFRLIWTNVPVAVLAPPNCSVRPPSRPKLDRGERRPALRNRRPGPALRPARKRRGPARRQRPGAIKQATGLRQRAGGRRAGEGCRAAAHRRRPGADPAVDRRRTAAESGVARDARRRRPRSACRR